LLAADPLSLRLDAAQAPPASGRLDVTAVHEQHADFVWLSLQRLGVEGADIEDLLQEVFVVVHRRLASFDGSSRLTTWLFGICVRVVAAYRRRAFRRRERVVAEIPEHPAPVEGSPEEAAAARQARARLGAVLDLMDLEKRALFVMFEIDELSCEAIAEMLSIPVGTVYSRLHAARKDFDRALARLQASEASRLGARRGGRP
jgi:RNA polymerase sigma-70 factor (ECF subfamily)